MQKRTFLFWGLVCLTISCTALPAGAGADRAAGTKLILLPDLIDPQSLYVDTGRIYITENHKIFVYSSTDHRLLRRFGRVGDEPDAFRKSGRRELRLILDVRGDRILVSSHERVSAFSKDGAFESVVGESPQIDYMAALGPNYLASAYVIEVGTGKSYQHAVLFDGQMEFVKTIAESHLGGGSAKGFGGPDRNMHFEMVPHYFGIQIYQDRIYLGDSYRGFVIDVYDSSGEKLYTIERDYEPMRVPDEYKKERLEGIREYRAYQRYKESTVIDETEYLPAFRSITVSGERIYAYTHGTRDSDQEVIVLDLDGNHLNTAYLPRAECSRVHDGKYYFVAPNENDEWELRVVDIDAMSSEEVKDETTR